MEEKRKAEKIKGKHLKSVWGVGGVGGERRKIRGKKKKGKKKKGEKRRGEREEISTLPVAP